MGAFSFTRYAPGVTVAEAWGRAADGEWGDDDNIGAGGYTVLQSTPILKVEAEDLADRMIERDDPRVHDKWGPCGAIAVIAPTREVRFEGVDYHYDRNFRVSYNDEGEATIDPNLLKALEPKIKLARGESIKSVSLGSYISTGGTTHRKGATGTVVIKKPARTRIAPIVIEIPANLDWEQRKKEISARVQTMKVKEGEKIVSWNAGADTPGKAKVTVTAPKGGTETRFVIKHNVRARKVGHETWEDGFPTQAKAREWMATVLQNDKNWEGFNGQDLIEMEVVSVTRRVDGQALVAARREVGKRMVNVDVVVKLANLPAQTQPDGWVFVGWAPE